MTLPIAIGILENGSNLSYIRPLLGHSSSKTTDQEVASKINTYPLDQQRIRSIEKSDG